MTTKRTGKPPGSEAPSDESTLHALQRRVLTSRALLRAIELGLGHLPASAVEAASGVDEEELDAALRSAAERLGPAGATSSQIERVLCRARELGLGDRLLLEDLDRLLGVDPDRLDEELHRDADSMHDVERAREALRDLIRQLRGDAPLLSRHPAATLYLSEVECVDVLDSPLAARHPGADLKVVNRMRKWLQRGRALCIERGSPRVRAYLSLRQAGTLGESARQGAEGEDR